MDRQAEERGGSDSRAAVLIVEDNVVNAQMLQDFLHAKRHRTHVVADRESAVAYAKLRRPAAILMDIRLRGTNGLQAIRTIRALPGLANVPIIALTSLAMADDKERILEAGSTAYLPKPVDFKELDALLSELLTGDDGH